MDKVYCWINGVRLFLLCCVMPTIAFAQMPQISIQDSVLNTALWSIGLTQADLAIRGDTLGDVDRFALTQRVLEEPARAMDLLPAFDKLTGPDLLQDALLLLGGEVSPEVISVSDVDVPEGLKALVRALMACQKQLDQIYVGFSAEEQHAFMSLIHLVDPGVLLSEAASDSLIALGRRVDRPALVLSTIRLMEAVDVFVALSPTLEIGVFDTPVGRVVVGGDTADVYAEPAALIIDLGGDDHYIYQMSPKRVSVVIDLGGDDIHTGASGSGIAGVNVVVDVQGKDRYFSEGIGQGVGMGGVGVLVDLAGDDFYQADVGGQGFGLYGVGILCDGAGADRYEGALLVQGVGAPGGVGILADEAGVDSYRAGGKYKDFREAGQYYQSMAQGFGYGVRPLASGGIGILVDAAGDDRYEVDYFGQGTGFWGSVGVLIDRQGKDQYVARRYAQGCGVHLAVGVLVDEIGDDVFVLWGVGQGCGHDLAVGRLIDLGGHDVYRATWLAQGVGNANGVGWLEDLGGDDVYQAEREDTQGFGVSARDYGSIGLLIDREGLDQYRLGRENGLVRSLGDYGVLVDWPLIWGAQ